MSRVFTRLRKECTRYADVLKQFRKWEVNRIEDTQSNRDGCFVIFDFVGLIRKCHDVLR